MCVLCMLCLRNVCVISLIMDTTNQTNKQTTVYNTDSEITFLVKDMNIHFSEVFKKNIQMPKPVCLFQDIRRSV